MVHMVEKNFPAEPAREEIDIEVTNDVNDESLVSFRCRLFYITDASGNQIV